MSAQDPHNPPPALCEPVVQWRACAKDRNDHYADISGWTDERTARRLLDEFADDEPAYDELWLERRAAAFSEPERVK